MPKFELNKIHENLYEMPKHEEMHVPARIYANKEIIDLLMEDIENEKQWNSLLQLYNVASLQGIVKYALAMSDVHPGYGFPIGGVGAFDLQKGVIAVGGVGFDINCGIRTMSTPLFKKDFDDEGKKEKLANQLFRDVPAGLGSTGDIELSVKEIDQTLVEGAEFAINRGYGFEEDLEYIEEEGRIKGADPENVSEKAKKRQLKEMGTLGSGNHYLEVQYISEIYDKKAAKAFGLAQDQVIVSMHCGSRGLGHQIGTDYLKTLEKAAKKYNIPIRERELVCAPFKSPEGQKYFSAVNAGVNCAFANRQFIAHLTRGAFEHALGVKPKEIKTFYEIGHNTVKVEEHDFDGQTKDLLVHRKGSTRGFGPGRKEVPEKYRKIGQPAIIGGTMGTHSYILSGTEKGMQETWGSACHGAGRAMSRMEAKKKWYGKTLVKELRKKGIIIKGHSMSGIAEEAPGSYKDVDIVVDTMHEAGVINKVLKMKPLIVIKG